MTNYVARFSATEWGGLPLTADMMERMANPETRVAGIEALVYDLARHGVAPEAMTADSLVDITPGITAKTGNNILIETAPVTGSDDRATRAIAHLMPRSAATINIDLADNDIASQGDPDRPQGEGRSFELENPLDVFPVVGTDGMLRELVVILPEAQFAALGRLAAHHRDQAS